MNAVSHCRVRNASTWNRLEWLRYCRYNALSRRRCSVWSYMGVPRYYVTWLMSDDDMTYIRRITSYLYFAAASWSNQVDEKTIDSTCPHDGQLDLQVDRVNDFSIDLTWRNFGRLLRSTRSTTGTRGNVKGNNHFPFRINVHVVQGNRCNA